MNAVRPWTPEDDTNLVRMRSVEHKTWVAIGSALGGRSKTACQVRYTKIVPKEDQVQLAGRRSWREEDEAEVRRLRYDEKKTVRGIAAIFGLTVGQIASKIAYMDRPSRRMHFDKETVRFVIPQRCLDDRNRRYLADPRDLTAALQGDPLPGYSALERRV